MLKQISNSHLLIQDLDNYVLCMSQLFLIQHAYDNNGDKMTF